MENYSKEKTPPKDLNSIEVSAFEYELPFLKEEGVQFEIIGQGDQLFLDIVRIRISPFDSYVMASYGVAMNRCGRVSTNNSRKAA